MNIIGMIDSIALLASILAVIFVYTGKWRKSNVIVRLFPIILVFINIFDTISNFMNLSTIWESLSPLSEAFQLILPIIWFFFLYTLLQERTTQKIKEEEERYLKAYNRAEFYKDLFVHDINNILQNIHSSTELSKIYVKSKDNQEKIEELFIIIDGQVKRGLKLISNIRGLSEIEKNEVNVKIINMKPILEQAIQYIRNSYQKRNIEIMVNYHNHSREFFVQANELLLEVFENIMINSVKHNDKEDIKIRIDVKKTKNKGNKWVKLEFSDNGIGIPDEKKGRIFQKRPFRREYSSGMGLGLSLVKEILQLFNSKISVHDRVKGDFSEGSTFIIEIPSFDKISD
ncbi:MAG: putative Histidine kinase [Promethearchaeota archaeon]|nr:MAG: putative Histidine kinase [Candidatus Lokiarchaeota archaeon]